MEIFFHKNLKKQLEISEIFKDAFGVLCFMHKNEDIIDFIENEGYILSYGNIGMLTTKGMRLLDNNDNNFYYHNNYIGAEAIYDDLAKHIDHCSENGISFE